MAGLSETLTNNQNISQAASSASRIWLISQTGTIRSIWLPSSMEGRYKFLDENGADDLPFYIEAEDGCWTANTGSEAFFFRFDPMTHAELSIGRSWRIAYKILTNIMFRNARYALYAEGEHSGDYTFVPYYFEEHTDYTIGRLENNHICYPNRAVSRLHASIRWDGSGWKVVNENSTNGVYVNGRIVREQHLNPGDSIFIMGMYILVGNGYFAINNANGRAQINTPRIREVRGAGDIFFREPAYRLSKTPLFDRQPRRLLKLEPDPISIDMPPMPLTANKMPLLLRLGSPMLMGGQALFNGNFLSAITSLFLPAATQGLTEKDRKEYEAKRVDRYRQYLDFIREEISKERREEYTILNENYPELNKTLTFATSKKRLWERRKNDEDFLSVRLGHGRIPMIAVKDYSPKKFEMERDFLVEEMYEIAEKPDFIDNAPVMLSLKEDHVLGVIGSKEAQRPFFRNMILQLAMTHSYDELKIVVLVDPAEAEEFDFIRYLPHNWDDEKSIRFFATAITDVQQIAKQLNSVMDGLGGDSKNYSPKLGPSYVIIALSKKLYSSIDIIKTVLNMDGYCGISIIAAFDNMPKECSKVIDLGGTQNRIIDFSHPETQGQEFSLDPFDEGLAHQSVFSLKHTKLMLDSAQFLLPPMVTFLEMYKAGKVEHLNPLKRWEENNPVKTLAAPVGVGADGQLFMLDLHEKRQGPHGLVAGMTGSGKSEFIITYILSMAVNYSPDEVAFVLIDYKGGGLAGAFEDKARGIHLPHLVGTITNLDGSAIQRSLVSINSELKRRQALFNKAKSETNEGTIDIYDYQKLYRNGRVKDPLPHLFIISDEFAELKSQQPDFMNELISTARIGRSLGVHLILATQKPSGVVNDQIWSNTKFRVCLRVQDRGDSMEMLKRPEAADIKSTGRFYLQVGYNELFALGQSAWCGAEYMPQDEVVVEVDNSVHFIDNVGQPVFVTKPAVKRSSSGMKQIVAIVKYLSDLAKRENIKPRSLWLDPLPPVIELEELIGKTPWPDETGIHALIGVTDDPEKQMQYPYFIDMIDFRNMLLVGSGGSGKSTFLRTMLYSMIQRYSPQDLNYYIIDLSNGMLNCFSQAPHCGAFLTEENSADFPRLFKFIQEIIAKRKELFSEAEVSSFEAYRRIHKIPLVLVIIDNFMNITTIEGGEDIFAKLQGYLREGANYGVRYILSTNHSNEVNARAKQEIDKYVALQAVDRYDYGDILQTKVKNTPPVMNGRGMCVIDGRPLEYHAALLDSGLPEQDRAGAMRQRINELTKDCPPETRAPRLAMADLNQEYDDFCAGFEPKRIPLGFSPEEMKAVAMPLRQLRSMSLYFGNPKGVPVIMSNLLYAAQYNGMEVIVVKRSAESVFDEKPLSEHHAVSSFLNCTPEDLTLLTQRLMDEIVKRNVYRDEFCRANNIPETAKGRLKKASKFICENTRPMLILIEGMAELCTAELDGDLDGSFKAFFEKMAGYNNIYFAGCFYPGDAPLLNRNEMLKSFNQEEFLLMFGGQFNKTPFQNLPYNMTKIDAPEAEFNRFLMKYQSQFHILVMPCGELKDDNEDPDEAAII